MPQRHPLSQGTSGTLMLRSDRMLRSDIDRCFQMTAPGTSALATVRIAGPGVVAFLKRRFSKPATPVRPVHGELRDDSGVIDDPVVILREDGFAADITLHGGAWITKCVMTLAERDGFAISPVDVDMIGSTDAATIFEHELLVSLPRARTELAVRTLLAQPEAWRRLSSAHPTDEVIELLLADRSLEHLLTPPTLAIVGLPNAGKSTLANRLFGQQRSIVSPIAGTTRDWVGEEANLDGLLIKLIDTPGRRATDDAIERAAISASDATIQSADAVLLLLDASRDDLAQDELALQFPDAMVVLNKIDQRLPSWSDERIRQLGAISVCARSGEGLDAVTARTLSRFGIDRDLTRPRVWTRRQREEFSAGAARF
jgi:small GTP-binding protein